MIIYAVEWYWYDYISLAMLSTIIVGAYCVKQIEGTDCIDTV